MSTVLSLQDLRIDLPAGADRGYALNKVSLDLNEGEILCLVGESGSGKSMTASAIMGLLPEPVRATAGRILFEGRDLLGLSDSEMRRIRGAKIGMIFQEPMTALNPLRTLGDQIGEVFRTHLRLSARAIKARVQNLLRDVHIPEPQRAARAYPHQLSGGQRQRAMIAMALALEPRVLIADEPTTALDVTTQAQILQLIAELQARKGTAVLFITHDFGVVAQIADRVAVMQQGLLVEHGSAEEILHRPRHAYTQALIAAVSSLAPPPGQPLSEQAILTLTDLTKTYRNGSWFKSRQRITHAVNGVSLRLANGSTLGIVGESGSGKSTLARCIVRLLNPDSGKIHFGNQDLASLKGRQLRSLACHVQMVFQDPYGSLNPRRRVGELVAQGPMIHGASREQALLKTRELFQLVGLDADAMHRYPHEFSGGQRQRIALARALALEPRILVADEPVSALDVSVQTQVLDLLAHLRQQLGLSILFITHDLRVAAQICDEILVMKDGLVVEHASASQIFSQPRHPYTQALINAVPGRDWQPPRSMPSAHQ